MITEKRKIALWCLTATLVLQGCGLTKNQKTGIETFGQAAATLGASSKDHFIAFRENVIEMKKSQLAMERFILPASQPDGTPPTREYYFSNSLNLDSGLDQDNIEKRVAAVELLQRYGNLLVSFTSDTQEKDLRDASDKFARSVESFTDNPSTSEEVKGLGDLVMIAGSFLVEHKKKDALEIIVPTVTPLIVNICDSIERDFDPKKKGITSNIRFAQDRLASDAINGLKQAEGSLSDRLLLINGFALAEKNREYIAATSKYLLKAVASLRTANNQLLQVIGHNKVGINEIREFSEDVADTAKAVKPFIGRF